MIDKKGQAIIQGFFIFFFLLVIVVVLLDPIQYFVELGVNLTNGTTHGGLLGTMFNYLPVFIVLSLLMAFIALVSVR